MTDKTGTGEAANEARLPTEMHEGWAPKELVYTLYSYDDQAPQGRRVIATTRSYALPDTDVKKFVEARLKRLPLPTKGVVREWTTDHPEPDRAINIYVTDPCWVVIELDPDIDWRFEKGRPGITSKAQYYNDNGGLRHVMPDGTLADDRGPTGDGCRIIFFGVAARGNAEHQKFRCHVIHGTSRLEAPDDVDPDIPNDGGRFPFPMVDVRNNG